MLDYFAKLKKHFSVALAAALSVLLLAPLSSFAEKPPGSRPTVALVLGGGLSRVGPAHVGVLKVFEKEGIPIDMIVGASVGAIYGGLFAAGVSTSELEKMVRNKSIFSDYRTLAIPVRILADPLLHIPVLWGQRHYAGLYRGEHFAAFINKTIPPPCRNVEQARIKFCAVAANLLDGKPCLLTKGNFGKVIQASSAEAILRRPVKMDGKLLADGGLVSLIPVEEARSLGADIIIAVDLDDPLPPEPAEKFYSLINVGVRAFNIIVARLDEHQVKNADIVIQPTFTKHRSLGSTAAAAMEAGEKAATEALPKIRQCLDRHGCASSEKVSVQ